MTPETAVLISIRPKWCELIANNQKTLEVRKSRPAIEPPFTCYIYCTRGRYEDRVSVQYQTVWDKWRGHVIGEFVCDRIHAYFMPESLGDAKACRDLREKALLKMPDLLGYCSTVRETLYENYRREFYSDLHGWRISGLHVYKKPLNLSVLSNLDGEPVKRAPQSWQYVTQNVYPSCPASGSS